MKKKTKMTFLAAAMTAVLLSGNIYPVLAENQAWETAGKVKTVSVFPDNVTVENPMALSEITLPKSEYGTFEWADSAYVPDSRVQSCKVILRPEQNRIEELSQLPGWEKDRQILTGYVTVVVSSLEDQEEPETEEITEKITEADSETEQQYEEEGLAASGEEPEKDSENDSVPEETASETEEETPQEIEDDQETAEQRTSAETEIPDSLENEDVQETPDEQASYTETEDSEADSREQREFNDTDADITDTTDTETQEFNIFDNSEDFTAPDPRTDEAAEDLTLEEQAAAARENHSYSGISVWGIDLPWYVQFRVSSGESYEFVNEKEATIFQSYEFELWNLETDTEYEIPDGQYVSVTVPVKAGYTYTIEHLLDNGARETIVPSVEGSTMIFSTHSFSPFGIAGSKALVGEEIMDDGYSDKNLTPTPALTVTPAAALTVTPAPGTTGDGKAGNGTGGTAIPGGNFAEPGTTGTSTGTENNNTGNTGGGSNTGNAVGNNGSGTAGASAAETGTAENVGTTGSGTQKQNITAAPTAQERIAQGIKAVKTGDSTVILPFIFLVVAAVIVIAVILVIRRRR